MKESEANSEGSEVGDVPAQEGSGPRREAPRMNSVFQNELVLLSFLLPF